MEADNSFENLSNLLSNHQTQLINWQDNQVNFQRSRVMVPPVEEVVSVIVVAEEKEKQLAQEAEAARWKEELEKESIIEGQIESEIVETVVTRRRSLSKNIVSKKRKLKRLKGKVKRRKKVRKYRGGCPGF